MMKRTTSLMLACVCVFLLASPTITTFAAVAEPDPVFTVNGEGIRIISVTEISNSDLPEEVQLAFDVAGGNDSVSLLGSGAPSASNTYDLSVKRYDFWVETKYDEVYSNYVFINHGGKVTMSIQDASGIASHDEFLVLVYVRDLFNTQVGQLAVKRNSAVSTFSVSNLGTNAKVFFSIDPSVYKLVYLPKGDFNYIKAG